MHRPAAAPPIPRAHLDSLSAVVPRAGEVDWGAFHLLEAVLPKLGPLAPTADSIRRDGTARHRERRLQVLRDAVNASDACSVSSTNAMGS